MKMRTIAEKILTHHVPYILKNGDVHMCYEDCDHIQPERSKREDLDCCIKVSKLEKYQNLIIHENIDIGESYGDYSECVDFLSELIQEFKMRCSEHCGNTVRDK